MERVSDKGRLAREDPLGMRPTQGPVDLGEIQDPREILDLGEKQERV